MTVCGLVQWKALPKDIKDRYEERAREIALDSKKISETSMLDLFPHSSDSRSMSPHLSASGISANLSSFLFRLFIFHLLVLVGFFPLLLVSVVA